MTDNIKCLLIPPFSDNKASSVMATNLLPDKPAVALNLKDFDAAIFDLDGVVTRTARVHAAAWKRLFDEYLEARAQKAGEAFRPFDSGNDYTRFVDGKPRYDGVRCFLESRDIWLPEGAALDPPDRETIAGLGNRKNRYFHESLEAEGVEVFEDTVALLGRLRKEGVRTALVSSSRNGRAVLAAAGLDKLFDVCIDGNDLAELALKGKPAPDLFLAAVRRLDAMPERAMVFEDAISGVQAGRAGHFRSVVGVDRAGHATDLLDNGADFVVHDLSTIRLVTEPENGHQVGLLSSREGSSELLRLLHGRQPAVFLDYDGTLTPIVDKPELAVLADDMRDAVANLASLCTVAIISGRDRADVEKLVGLEGLIYAGSHGFDIAGPGGLEIQHENGTAFVAAARKAVTLLENRLSEVSGALIEPKKFAVAVHYRQADPSSVPSIEKVVDDVVVEVPELIKTYGKKVFELRPNMDWDKGKALLWLLAALQIDRPDVVPIYLGDDETDEDALEVVADSGIGIFVGEPTRDTAARFVLASPKEVRDFLLELAAIQRARADD